MKTHMSKIDLMRSGDHLQNPHKPLMISSIKRMIRVRVKMSPGGEATWVETSHPNSDSVGTCGAVI